MDGGDWVNFFFSTSGRCSGKNADIIIICVCCVGFDERSEAGALVNEGIM